MQRAVLFHLLPTMAPRAIESALRDHIAWRSAPVPAMQVIDSAERLKCLSRGAGSLQTGHLILALVIKQMSIFG